MIDDKPGRRDDRRKLTKSAITAVALELPDVNPNDLTAWDKAALDQIREIKRAAELEEVARRTWHSASSRALPRTCLEHPATTALRRLASEVIPAQGAQFNAKFRFESCTFTSRT